MTNERVTHIGGDIRGVFLCGAPVPQNHTAGEIATCEECWKLYKAKGKAERNAR